MNKLLLTIATLFAYSGIFAQTWNVQTGAWISPLSKNIGIQKNLQVGGNVGTDTLWCNTDLNYFEGRVGIGTITPAGKFHVVDNPMNALFDSTGIYLLVGNDTFFISESGINAFSNIGGGSGYLASLQDTLVNFQVNRGDTIGEYINYGWAWDLAGSTASADSVARLRWDGIARAWNFAIDGGNTVFRINADDETVQVHSLAGSAQKLVTALANGTLDTASMLLYFKKDTLTSADLLAGGDVILIDSVPGKIIRLDPSLSFTKYVHNTSAYVGATGLSLRINGGTGVATTAANWQTASTKRTQLVGTTPLASTVNFLVGRPLEASFPGGALTTGDGILVLYLYYSLIDD